MLQVYKGDGFKQVNCDSYWTKYASLRLFYCRAIFSLLLHLVGFGRRHFYVNGIDLAYYSE